VHRNETLVRDGYEAMARGDGRGLAEMLTDTSRWVVCGRGKLAATYTGRDEIFTLWKKIADQTGGGLQLELRDVLANDERAIALVTARGRRGDRQLAERQVALFEMDGGKITEATFVYENPDVYDSFWED
jgi:ketosteroid isomerase-like protein